jgi:Protein of unknown function (DUF3606)
MSLSKPEKPIRHLIEADNLQHWSRRWKVLPEDIRATVDKVGNAVTAVEKELRLRGLLDKEG